MDYAMGIKKGDYFLGSQPFTAAVETLAPIASLYLVNTTLLYPIIH